MDIILPSRPYTGPKPTLLQAIKALPSEIRELIWVDLLYFYGWEDKMPELILAVRGCSCERALYEELLHIFYCNITFQLKLLYDWELKGFTKNALRHVRNLEIELFGSWVFPILLTPASLAELTKNMPGLESVHLTMDVNFTSPRLLGSLPPSDRRHQLERPLPGEDLPTWLAAFKSVKSLAITFDVTHWKKVKVKKFPGDAISLEEEDVPDWFEEWIKLIEERVGKKSLRSQPPRPSQPQFCERDNVVLGGGQRYELKFRWTGAAESTLNFSEKSAKGGGVAIGPNFLRWSLK